MIFEQGKFYQHTTGSKLFICGTANTIFYGDGLIGEDENGNLSRVGNDEASAVNFKEVTKEEYMKEIEARN